MQEGPHEAMTETIILPGIGGSCRNHWQSYWEAANPSFRRFRPNNWNQPDQENWITALGDAIKAASEPPLIIAHSLGCLLVAHAAQRNIGSIRGAFLVSVPDPDGAVFPREAKSFGRVPYEPLPFASLIVASTDDPLGSLTYARKCALAWQSELIEIGAHGHINAESGLGAWHEGLALYRQFCIRTGVL